MERSNKVTLGTTGIPHIDAMLQTPEIDIAIAALDESVEKLRNEQNGHIFHTHIKLPEGNELCVLVKVHKKTRNVNQIAFGVETPSSGRIPVPIVVVTIQ